MKNKNLLLDILGIISVWIYILGRTFIKYGNYFLTINVFLGCIYALLLIYARYFYLKDIIPFLLICTCGILNVFYVGELRATTLLFFLLGFLPLGVYLARGKYFNSVLWRICVYSVIAYLILFMYKHRGTELLFVETSRNYVSVYLIIITFIYSVVLSNLGRQLSTPYLFIFTVMCIAAVGRGGIISAFALILGLFIIRRFRDFRSLSSSNLIKNLLILIALIFLGYFFIKNSDYIVQTFFNRFVTHARFGSNQERTEMYLTYIRAIRNTKNLFLGLKPEDISGLIYAYGGNVHNSIMMFHARYGLIATILVVVRQIWSIYCLFKLKKPETAIIIIVFIIRSLTDTMYPEFLGDLVIWYCIYIQKDNKQNPYELAVKL